MPATPVSLPSVLESFNRAMLDILEPIFSTGFSRTWNNKIVNFYDCDFVWNHKGITEPRDKMMIAFLGNRTSGSRDEKCTDPLGVRRFAYERRETLYRTVYVGVAKTVNLNQPPYPLPNTFLAANMSDCDRVWSQLAWTFKHELATFEAAGIFKPQIPFVPAEYPMLDYWMVIGQFSCEVRFKHTIGN